jgi:hypothetical protein
MPTVVDLQTRPVSANLLSMAGAEMLTRRLPPGLAARL